MIAGINTTPHSFQKTAFSSLCLVDRDEQAFNQTDSLNERVLNPFLVRGNIRILCRKLCMQLFITQPFPLMQILYDSIGNSGDFNTFIVSDLVNFLLFEIVQPANILDIDG